jgi:hypothetical protein
VPIDASLVRAEVLVSERNADDGEEGKRKDEARGYVPAPKDDTGILDLGVPTYVEAGVTIAVKAESSPESEGGDGMGSYAPEHVGFTGWIHVHVAVAVSVIHCRALRWLEVR